MAYKKQTWKVHDVITAEKLNHIEEYLDEQQNSPGYLLRVNILNIDSVNQTITLDHSYEQIFNALLNGSYVKIYWDDITMPNSWYRSDDYKFEIEFIGQNDIGYYFTIWNKQFYCDALTDTVFEIRSRVLYIN